MYIPQTVTDTPTTVSSDRSVCPLGLIHPPFPPRKEKQSHFTLANTVDKPSNLTPHNTQLAQSSPGRSSPDIQQPDFHISVSWKVWPPERTLPQEPSPRASGIETQGGSRSSGAIHLLSFTPESQEGGVRKAEKHLASYAAPALKLQNQEGFQIA